MLSTTRISRGNAVEAVDKSAHVVTHRYVTPHTEHAFLEPESSLAVPQGDGGMTVYAGSQSVYEDRRGIASILGLPHEKVRVVGKLVGGAFGGKEDLSVQHHAALLAMRVGKPVKLTLTRRESILVHPKRHAMEIEITTACDDRGKLTAVIARITADTGAYASLGGPVLQRACTHVAGPYHVPNAEITGWAVYTNNPPAGAFRGFGVPQVCFACETNMDLLAERAGISPWEVRYRNALEPGITMATGQIAGEDTAIKETLLAVKEIYQTNQVFRHRLFHKKYWPRRGSAGYGQGQDRGAKRQGPGSYERRLRRPGSGYDPHTSRKRGYEPPGGKGRSGRSGHLSHPGCRHDDGFQADAFYRGGCQAGSAPTGGGYEAAFLWRRSKEKNISVNIRGKPIPLVLRSPIR